MGQPAQMHTKIFMQFLLSVLVVPILVMKKAGFPTLSGAVLKKYLKPYAAS